MATVREAGNPQVYQIDFTAVACGKRVSSSKRKVRWRFGFANPEALDAGETGTDCRGEEHDVTLHWSITSGKRLLMADGKEVHYTTNRGGVFDFSWTMRGNHVLKVVAHASPPLSPTPGFRQYDFFVDGQTFFSFPKVYRLGLAANDPRITSAPRSFKSVARHSSAEIRNLEAPHNPDEEEAYLQEAIKNSLKQASAEKKEPQISEGAKSLLLDFLEMEPAPNQTPHTTPVNPHQQSLPALPAPSDAYGFANVSLPALPPSTTPNSNGYGGAPSNDFYVAAAPTGAPHYAPLSHTSAPASYPTPGQYGRADAWAAPQNFGQMPGLMGQSTALQVIPPNSHSQTAPTALVSPQGQPTPSSLGFGSPQPDFSAFQSPIPASSPPVAPGSKQNFGYKQQFLPSNQHFNFSQAPATGDQVFVPAPTVGDQAFAPAPAPATGYTVPAPIAVPASVSEPYSDRMSQGGYVAAPNAGFSFPAGQEQIGENLVSNGVDTQPGPTPAAEILQASGGMPEGPKLTMNSLSGEEGVFDLSGASRGGSLADQAYAKFATMDQFDLVSKTEMSNPFDVASSSMGSQAPLSSLVDMKSQNSKSSGPKEIMKSSPPAPSQPGALVVSNNQTGNYGGYGGMSQQQPAQQQYMQQPMMQQGQYGQQQQQPQYGQQQQQAQYGQQQQQAQFGQQPFGQQQQYAQQNQFTQQPQQYGQSQQGFY